MCCALLVFFAAACVATDTEAHVQDQIHALQGDNNALHAEVATLKAKLKAKGAESDAKVAAIKAAIPAKQLASIMTAARVERCPGDTPASVLNGAARCTSSLGLGGNDGPAKQLVGEGAVGVDWKQCKSEGGSMNCAKCSDQKGGALPCNKVMKGMKPSQCPDDMIVRTRKVWVQSGVKGNGDCLPLNSKPAFTGMTLTTWRFPGIGKSLVLTKTWVTTPHKSNRRVGIVMFKRLVTHTCSGERPNFCEKGATVADVHKVGYCVKCDYDVFPSWDAAKANNKHRKSFVERCLPKAIDEKGNIKPAFQCDPKDSKFASASIAGF